MHRIKTILKNKNGMTLVEVIVTIIIATVLIAITGSLLLFGMRMFSNTTQSGLDSQIGDSMTDFVVEQLLYADEIKSGTDADYGTMKATANDLIFVGDEIGNPRNKGYLYYRKGKDGAGSAPRRVHGNDYYNGRTMSIVYKVDKVTYPKAVTVTVKLFDKDDKEVYKKSKSIQLLNVGDTSQPTQTGTAPTGTNALILEAKNTN